VPQDRDDARRRALVEASVVVAVAALIAAVYLSFAHYGFDVLEEGYFLHSAQRLLEGELPYRDFNTPYTPGVFYVYAWVIEHFGSNVVLLRSIQVVARFALMLALYVAGRQVTSPFYAALPPALIIGMDTVPGVWSLHPGWLTTPCALLAVIAIARYTRGGGVWWLALTGVAAGVGFAFKQNLAAYGLMAALWLLVVCERRLLPLPWGRHVGSPALRWGFRTARAGVQAAALVLLPLVPAMIALPYMSGVVIGALIAPLVAVSLLGLWRIVRDAGRTPVTYGRELAFYVRPLVVLACFGAVTAAWFLPFYSAIGDRADLLGPLFGRIEQTGYYLGMLPPGLAHLRVVAVALLPAAVLPALGLTRLWGRLGVALALAGAAVVVAWTAIESWTRGRPWNAFDWLLDLRGLARSAGTIPGEGPYSLGELILYLPSLAFWVGLVVLITSRNRRGLKEDLVPLWYLAAGAALLFNQYPRMDSIHLLWSGGMLFVVGAAAVERWEGLARRLAPALARGSGTVALRLALVVLPLVAALPTVIVRFEYAGQFFRPVAAPEELTRREGPYGLLRLNVDADEGRVWLPGKDALMYQEMVSFLHSRTTLGEPIFAYPAIPGIYYLAARWNPTPFDHLFPGIASDADQREIVRQLERVNYIVWDDAGAHYWVTPGVNAPVTEYIVNNFRIERFFGQYAVLSREAVIDWGEPLYYPLPSA